jgi:transcriptional regulator with XRE-family HTH domain
MSSEAISLSTLGSEIRSRREHLGLTQSLLAKLTGLSRATINTLENGAIEDLGLAKVLRLLDVLGLTLHAQQRHSQGSQLQQGSPGLRALRAVAKSASTSYRTDLPPDVLAAAIRTGKIPSEYRAHFATLLDEIPVPLLIRAVEASFTSDVPKSSWRHIEKWASEFKSPRDIWH